MKDKFGDRMKSYENTWRTHLPRRGYTILRLDGRAFHTYTKKLKKPFDMQFIKSMDRTAKYLCENIMGARFAYVQSDEINILMTDFEKLGTQPWFDGNIQKITSVAAGLASSFFSLDRARTNVHEKPVAFDARVFFLADPFEVENVFIWRQQDAVRNSVQQLAQSLYSHKQLHGKNTPQLHDLIHEKGLNWDKLEPGLKRGRVVKKITYQQISEEDPETGLWKSWDDTDPEHFLYTAPKDPSTAPKRVAVTRTGWAVVEPPTFTQDRSFLRNMIPKMHSFDEGWVEQSDWCWVYKIRKDDTLYGEIIVRRDEYNVWRCIIDSYDPKFESHVDTEDYPSAAAARVACDKLIKEWEVTL